MKSFFFVLIVLSSTPTMAQEYLSQGEGPTLGGTEKGIPDWIGVKKDFSTYGYFLASLTRDFDLQKPTHVIVVGPGGPSGLLFQLAAAAQAQKLSEVFPQHQTLLIASDEFGNGENQRRARNWGFHVFRTQSWNLTLQMLLSEVSSLRSIASIDIFAHSNEENGIRLDDFWPPEDRQIKQISNLMTIDSWVIFHGCNSGWHMAPAVSEFLRVPVAGSFTGTHFERPHEHGDFFPYDVEAAPPGKFLEINSLSYNAPRACKNGSCVRMKPDSHTYDGTYGKRDDGLNFYKYFCRGVRAQDCFRRMSLSLLGFIGKTNSSRHMSLKDYKVILYEYMCSIHKDRNWRTKCIEATERGLANGNNFYSPFWGRSVQCDFQTCRSTENGEPTTTYMNEVKAYLKGFNSLKNTTE